MNNRTVCSFGAVLLGSVSLTATTYWIGHADDPDSELRDLKGGLLPGDEIIIYDGTYTDQALKFIAMGSAEEPIVLRAETPGGVLLNGTSYLQFDGSYLQVEGLLWYNGDDYLRKTNSRAVEFRGSENGHAHFCRLTNCAIIDYNYQFLDTDDSDDDGNTEEYLWAHSKKWIEIYGTHNRVDHCYFYKKRTEGSLLVVELSQDSSWLDENPIDPDADFPTPQYPTIQHQIDHNYFGDIELGRPDKTENNEAIRVGVSTFSTFNAEVVIENNYFYSCNGDAEVISNKSGNNIIRNNVLLRCQGGIVMRHGDGCLVANNIILGQGISNSSGIRLNGQDHVVVGNYISDVKGTNMRAAINLRNAGSLNSDDLLPTPVIGDDLGGGYEQARFNTIAFNTVVNCTEPLNLGSSGSDDNDYKPVSNTIVNNLIYAPSAAKAIVTSLTSTQFSAAVSTWGGNLFYASTLGTSAVSGVSFEDPLVEMRPDGFMTLSSASPGVGAAVSGYDTLSMDMDGETVSAALGNIGADQVSSVYSVQAQMSLAEVGPDWNSHAALPPFDAVEVHFGDLILEVEANPLAILSDYGFIGARDLASDAWFPVANQVELSEAGTLTFTVSPADDSAASFYRIDR